MEREIGDDPVFIVMKGRNTFNTQSNPQRQDNMSAYMKQ